MIVFTNQVYLASVYSYKSVYHLFVEKYVIFDILEILVTEMGYVVDQ